MNLKKKIKQELMNEQQGGVQVANTIVVASCECVDWSSWNGVTPLTVMDFGTNIQPNSGQWVISSQFGQGGCNSGNSYAGTVLGGFPKTVNGNPPQVGDKVQCTNSWGGIGCQYAGPSGCYVILYVHTDLAPATGNYNTCPSSCGPVPGCTDSNAFNHDPSATQDDGSCDYGWRCGQLPGGGAIAEQVSMPTGCMPGTATNVGVFPTEAFCLSQNTNVPNGCGGTSMGAKVKPIEPIEPIGVDVKIKDTEIDLEKEPIRKKIKEELNRLEDMDYHNTPDMEKDMSRDEIENLDDTIGQVEFQDELVTLSSSERAQLRDMLEDSMDDKRKLEEAFDYKGIPELKAQGVFGKMFKWLKRYLTDKATTYLINASVEETKDTIELIKVMDPNDMTGIFDPKAIYLGGAIDFAKDALGWRTAMERYFGENHVVKDERMAKLVLTGEWDTKGISEPAILNPMRAETVREEDEEFTDLFGKWKKDSLTDDEMQSFREKIRQNIILQDLRMLDICDTNLLRYDGKAGAGTLGEAQISALKNQQIFLWVTDGMKISNVSPWLLPAVTKICIDDEIWELLKNFK